MASTASMRGSTLLARCVGEHRRAYCTPSLHAKPARMRGLALAALCMMLRRPAQVLRDARKGSSEVVADEAQASLLLVAHDLALKKMYNNVACLGGGPR